MVAALAQFIAARLGVADRDIVISLVESRQIKKLNRDFRAKDKATDVLSFPQQVFVKPLKVLAAAKRTKKRLGPPDPLGDVVISLPEADKNARAIGQNLDREVCFLLVHGILHLCGHDHMEPKEEKRMLTEQRKLMALLVKKGGPNGKPLWTRCVRRLAAPRKKKSQGKATGKRPLNKDAR